MRLVINFGSIYKGGAEQVALSFLHECCEFAEHEYFVIVSPSLSQQIVEKDFPENFSFYFFERRPASGILSFAKAMQWYRKFEKKVTPHCVISTGSHGYWKAKNAPTVGGFNIPHYIYTESPYFNRMGLKKRLFWMLMRKVDLYFTRRLDAVLVQTEDVKDRISRQFKSEKRIYTVSNTVNTVFFQNQSYPKKLTRKASGGFRFLTLSSYYSHKNLEIIKHVIPALKRRGLRDLQFILTLPQEKFIEAFGEVDSEDIINVGPVPIKECPSLYEECDFMFLPTLLECFSASYAEAMVMRKPILTSDLSFARTVCGDAAVYFDPLDAEDIAEKISILIGNREEWGRMTDMGEEIIKSLNTAKQRAKKYLEICESEVDLFAARNA